MRRNPFAELLANDTVPMALLATAGAGTAAIFGWLLRDSLATHAAGGGAGKLVGLGLIGLVVIGCGASAVAGLLSWRRTARLATMERDRAETALRRAEEYHRLFRNAGDAILIVDPRSDAVRDANHRACELFDIPREHIVGRTLASVMHDTHRLRARLSSLLAGEVDQEFESVHYRADGTAIHFLVTARLGEFQGEPAVMVSYRDISERKAFERKLAHDAFHDSLTGLANRALFRDRVEHAIARTLRNPHQLVVLYFDLDNFKTINDTLGHASGDELLACVGRRLTACARVTDTVARLGGDEFAILLEDAQHPEDSIAVAERIIEELSAPISLEGREIGIGSSIGIAAWWGADSADELLRQADVAMYAAKSHGKGGYAIYEPGLEAASSDLVDLEADFEHALQRGEMVLHYQPIVDLRDGRLAGVEALVRWNHPARGLILPGSFLPFAEQSGMIVALGEWVLATACDQMGSWLADLGERAPEYVTVNVSAQQFLRGDLPALVNQALDRSEIDPHRLTLEFTEAALMHDSEAVLSHLKSIRELGVRVAIDDFGTGYSSLSYLRRLDADLLKIDRAFIEGVGIREEDSALARAIVALADTLRMRTVAEGVRSQEQAAVLASLGCVLGQGFFFSPPVPAAELAAMLHRVPELSYFGGEYSARDLSPVA